MLLDTRFRIQIGCPTVMKRKMTQQAGDDRNKLKRLSMSMSKVLRHHPPPGGLDAQGYVPLQVLVKHLNTTEELVRQVVDTNDKVCTI